MIKPTTITLLKGNHLNTIDPVSCTQREEGALRVNWITQKSQRQSINKDRTSNNKHQYQLIDNNTKYLKTCLQKEINLIPSAQNNDKRNHHLIQSGNSQNQEKHSCDKKQKLSLMSKRPSLRKINNFISFKEQTFVNQNAIEHKQKLQNILPLGKQNENQTKRQGKKCIRISSKRQCLGQIKN